VVGRDNRLDYRYLQLSLGPHGRTLVLGKHVVSCKSGVVSLLESLSSEKFHLDI